MPHHPKFVRSGPEAFAFFVAGLCYCNRYGTGGLIPKLALPSLLPGLGEHRAMELAMRLATNGSTRSQASWLDAGECIQVHDYEVYQPSRGEKREEGEERAGWDGRERARSAEGQGPGQLRKLAAARGGGGAREVMGRGMGDLRDLGDVTRDVEEESHQDPPAVTRYGHAAQRYGGAPLPGPLPRTRPVPYKREVSLGGWEEREHEKEQVKRAQNAARQRRFRERRRAACGDDVTRYVTRYGDGHGNGHGESHGDGHGDASDGSRYGDGVGVDFSARPRCSAAGRSELSTAADREQRERALNAARQRRFRARHAARRSEAADGGSVTRYGHGVEYRHPDAERYGPGYERRGPGAFPPRALSASPTSPVPCGNELPLAPGFGKRDRQGEFRAWFAVYPRQEGEVLAGRAWMAEPELPPLAFLLERLVVQKIAKPDGYFWPAADRYLRERRWHDQPPPAPSGRLRAGGAERRGQGSDDAGRQRLREISAEAWFDPEAPDF